MQIFIVRFVRKLESLLRFNKRLTKVINIRRDTTGFAYL